MPANGANAPQDVHLATLEQVQILLAAAHAQARGDLQLFRQLQVNLREESVPEVFRQILGALPEGGPLTHKTSQLAAPQPLPVGAGDDLCIFLPPGPSGVPTGVGQPRIPRIGTRQEAREAMATPSEADLAYHIDDAPTQIGSVPLDITPELSRLLNEPIGCDELATTALPRDGVLGQVPRIVPISRKTTPPPLDTVKSADIPDAVDKAATLKPVDDEGLPDPFSLGEETGESPSKPAVDDAAADNTETESRGMLPNPLSIGDSNPVVADEDAVHDYLAAHDAADTSPTTEPSLEDVTATQMQRRVEAISTSTALPRTMVAEPTDEDHSTNRPVDPVGTRLNAGQLPLPTEWRSTSAGPFQTLARLTGVPGHLTGGYLVEDLDNDRVATLRLVPRGSSTARGRQLITKRLEALQTKPSNLVDVLALDEFEAAWDANRGGLYSAESLPPGVPTEFRIHRGGRLGFLEEPQDGWVSVEDWLQTRPSYAKRLERLRDVAAACAALDQAGVTHTRLGPWALAMDASRTIRVLGWAYASTLPTDHRESRHHDSEEPLSLDMWFLAPEVLFGGHRAEEYTDYYSFGVLCYWLLTGSLPPSWNGAKTMMQCIHAVESGIAEGPAAVNPDVSADLDRLVLSLMQRDAARRKVEWDVIDQVLAGSRGFTGSGTSRLPRSAPPETRSLKSPTGAKRADGPGTNSIEIRKRLPELLPKDARFPSVSLPSAYEMVKPVAPDGPTPVFQVRHRQTGGVFALKMHLLPEGEGRDIALKAADHEISLLRRCQGTPVISLQDLQLGKDDGEVPYQVMAWADGWPGVGGGDIPTLHHLQTPVTEPVGIWIAGKLLRALDHIHSRGVVHYNVRPSNWLCFRDGGLKLSGFSVANYQSTFYPAHKDRHFGTPAYMSPEQVRREVEPDYRSDLFALGIVLYECLCGKHPFQFAPAGPKMPRRLPVFRPPIDLRDLAPNPISDAMWELVHGLMQPDLSKRPQSAAQAYEMLKRAPGHPASWSSVKATLTRKSD